MDAEDRMIYSTLSVPESRRGEQDQYYSRKSGILILDGPRGHLLARYLGDGVPDPDRFLFSTRFKPNYSTYDRAKPPSEATPTVVAQAWPIEKRRDPREEISSGTSGKPMENRSGGGPKRMISASSGKDKTMMDLEGIQITPNRMDLQAGGSGMSIEEDGVKVEGGFSNPNTQNKGLGKESPLTSILPKTIITFPFTGFLPDTKQLEKLMGFIVIIMNSTRVLTNLIKASDQLTD